MNQIIINDREIFEELNTGKVPACIKNQIYQEFLEYEKEIKKQYEYVKHMAYTRTIKRKGEREYGK